MNNVEEAARAAVRDVLKNAAIVKPVQPDGVILTTGAELRIEPIRWLWDGWLARGKFHLLAGAPGQGKTTIAVGFAAAVTCGGVWPDGTKAKAGNVLIYSGEDDPADTLGPRLLAAGADMRRVRFIDGIRTDGKARPFDLAADLPRLRAAIAQIEGGVDLIIVDPVVGAVTGDSHKNTETRRGLQPLAELAADVDCALLGITHFQKGGQGSDPAMRVIGSVAFTALARVVMVAARVQGEDGQPARVLARAKSNIGPDDGGYGYSLDFREVADGITAMRVAWGAAVEGTARELLTDPDDEEANDGSAATDALTEELSAGGWFPAKAVTKSLNEAGFSKKQVWTASKKIGVIRKLSGFQGAWYWRLPGGPNPPLPTAETASDSASDSSDSNKKGGNDWESLDEKKSLPDAENDGEAAAEGTGNDVRETAHD